MISWDACCIFESIRVGKTEEIFSKISDMVCLKQIFEEIKKNKRKFVSESKDKISLLNDDYGIPITIENIIDEYDSFISKVTPYSDEKIEKGFKIAKNEIALLKNFKFGYGEKTEMFLTTYY